MAGFQKLDKKQVPQVIGLGVASAGLFGYFAVKMIVPTASAATPAAATAPATAAATATTAPADAGTASDTDDAGTAPDAPAPAPGMRDPFVPLIGTIPVAVPAPAAAPPTLPAVPSGPAQVQAATAHTTGGGFAVPAGLGPLPPVSPGTAAGGSPASVGAVAPLPVAPPAPAWTVTGVVQSGSQNVAILRDGSVRAFVAPGDLVGDEFRVVDVTGQSVVLRHGAQRYTLPLGGPPKAPLGTGSPVAPTADATAPVPASLTPDATSPTDTPTSGDTPPAQQQFQAIMQKLNTFTGSAPAGDTPDATK